MSSPSRHVSRYLQELHQWFINRSTDSALNAQLVLNNLSDIVLQDLNTEEQDLCSQLLFRIPSSKTTINTDLLTEFSKTITNKKYTINHQQIIRLIANYITHIQPQNIEPFAIRIQKTFLRCINIGNSDKTKCMALQCLDKLYLISQFDIHSSPKTIEHTIKLMFNLLSLGPSKVSESVKGCIFRLLGILSNRYSSHFQIKQLTHLSKLYTKYIHQTIENNKNSKKVNRKLVEGIINGLQYFLNNHSLYIPIKPGNKDFHSLRIIWNIVINYINIIGHENRFAIAIACMNLLNYHSPMFMPYIIALLEKDARNGKSKLLIIESVLNCCWHKNRDVNVCAMNCIESLLSAVSYKLMEKPVKKSVFHKIYDMIIKRFHGFLKKAVNSSMVNDREMAVAIRAFGQLAHVIVIFDSMKSLHLLMDSLITMAKRIFYVQSENEIRNETNEENSNNSFSSFNSSSMGNGMDRMLKQFPSFLSTFSCIIYNLDIIDDKIIQQLSNMINIILRLYIKSWHSLRYKIQKSLLRLLVVMYTKGNLLNKMLDRFIYSVLAISITTLNENYSRAYGGSSNRKCYEEYHHFWRGLLLIDMVVNTDDNVNVVDDKFMRSRWWRGLQMESEQANQLLFEMRSILFDSIMKNMLQILTSFNLSFSVDGGISNLQMIMNNMQNVQLSNANDFELFLNFVPFFQLFLNNICTKNIVSYYGFSNGQIFVNPYFEQFQTWSIIYIESAIEISFDHPMISGLYRILKCVFQIISKSDNIQLFNDGRDIDIDMDMDMDMDVSNGKRTFMLDEFHKCLIYKYIQSCTSKLQTYRDELLYSCIELLLNIPQSFLAISYLVPAVIRALKVQYFCVFLCFIVFFWCKIGLTHLPAGELAVGVLEKWCEDHLSEVQPHFKSILPHLEPYLLITNQQIAGVATEDESDNKADDAEDDDEDDEKSNVKTVVKSKKDQISDENAVEYHRKKILINRILVFLGKLGGDNQALLIEKSSLNSDGTSNEMSLAEAAGKGTSVNPDIIAWDDTMRIHYVWSFPDTKLHVYLDSLLPRICELALNSTDRRTKIAACEALHAIIVKMIADNASDPNLARKKQDTHTEYEKIYLHLFPTILQLAVGIETVSKQLFSTLVIQLIHWFTQNIDSDNDETMALLDSITDALGNFEDAALRDFAGKCMAEFVKWSLKHKGVEKGALNIRSLLRRLYGMLKHSSAHKRLGACLTFHYIYRQFREQPRLVSLFVLDILTNLIESLAMASHDKLSGIDTSDETRRCIEHYEKMITHPTHGCFVQLNKSHAKREGDKHCRSLKYFIEWLFENLGRTEDECRRQCMILIQSLTPVTIAFGVKGSTNYATSITKWFEPIIHSRKLTYIVSVFEGGRNIDLDDEDDDEDMDNESKNNKQSVLNEKPKQIPNRNTMNAYEFDKQLKICQKWLANLSTILDNYKWMIDCQIIPCSEKNTFEKLFKQQIFPSKLFDSCKQFLLFLKPLKTISSPLILKLKCDCIIRLFRLFDILIRNKLISILNNFVEYELFYELLIECLLIPDTLGFLNYQPLRIKSMQKQFESIIKSLSNYSLKKSFPYKIYLVEILKKYIHTKSDGTSLNDWTTDNFFLAPSKSILMLRGLLILSKTSFILQESIGSVEEQQALAVSISDDIFDLCDKPLEPLNIEICSRMLSIALRLDLPATNLMQYLSDDSETILAVKMMDKNSDESKDDSLNIDDEDLLTNDNLMNKGCKGLVFYERFAVVLDSYFLVHFEIFRNIILNRISNETKEKQQLLLILVTILQHIIDENSTQSKTDIKHFLNDLILHFANNMIFDVQSEENVRLHLNIIRQYLMICGMEIFDESSKSDFDKSKKLEYIKNVLRSALLNRSGRGNSRLSVLIQAMNLLPFFMHLLQSKSVISEWLTDVLGDMTSYQFPQTSAEPFDGSKSQWMAYTTKMKTMLDVICITQSFPLIEIFVSRLREKYHKYQLKIDEKMDFLIGNLIDPLKQSFCLQFAIDSVLYCTQNITLIFIYIYFSSSDGL